MLRTDFGVSTEFDLKMSEVTTHEGKDDVEDNKADKVHPHYAKGFNLVLVSRILCLRRGYAKHSVDCRMRHDEELRGSA